MDVALMRLVGHYSQAVLLHYLDSSPLPAPPKISEALLRDLDFLAKKVSEAEGNIGASFSGLLTSKHASNYYGAVQVGWDVARYADDVGQKHDGRDAEKERDLLEEYPVEAKSIKAPFVVLDKRGRRIGVILPGAITAERQVSVKLRFSRSPLI